MRKSREQHLLPLQAGVPYKMANGERRMFDCIEDIAFNGYDLATGQHASARHLDITEFWIDNAIWRLKNGLVVVTQMIYKSGYPIQTYLMEMLSGGNYLLTGLNEYGYEYNNVEDDEYGHKYDIVAYVAPIEQQQIENVVWFDKRLTAKEYELVHRNFPVAWNTGAHISTTDPDLLAYFPTQKHWDNKVPQKIKAGRYLKKYFPDMPDDEIRQKANLLTGNVRTLKVLTHWYDMFVAYRTLDVNGIVSSCMTKDCWRPVHPLMVYHESDVQLVVMYECDEPKARTLANKHTNEFNIIYGQWERMLPMLEKAGYTHGSLDGAKINKLQRYPSGVSWDDLKESIESIRTTEYSNILMPYIDGHRDHSRSSHNWTCVDMHADYCQIHQHGDYNANDHDNAMVGADNADNAEMCEVCEEDYPYGDGYYLEWEGITVCEHCYRNNTESVITHYSSTRGSTTERVTMYYARDNCTYVDEACEWYMSSIVAEDAGWVWSDFHDCWMDTDDCVRMKNGDWISKDEEGEVFTFDEEEGEYVFISIRHTDDRTSDLVA